MDAEGLVTAGAPRASAGTSPLPSQEELRPDLRFDDLVEMLQERASRQGAKRVFTFLRSGEEEEGWLTFEELRQRALALAAKLQEEGFQGERALLLYPPGLDFISAFFGCLCAGVLAVPCYPPAPSRLERSLQRLLAIAADCRPRAVLTTAALRGQAARFLPPLPGGESPAWIATDEIADGLAGRWRKPPITAGTTAFLQYTSGSTSAPRGVMVSHGNLLHNLAAISSRGRDHAGTVGMSWLPSFHDMGLIQGILHPVFSGFPTYLMAPATFLQRPLRWLEGISRYRVTMTGGPNFAYELCVRKTRPEQRRELDLSCWENAYNGAEPVFAETLEAFRDAFAPSGLRWSTMQPVYGLAEATLLVSWGLGRPEPVFLPVDSAALERNRIQRAGPGTRNVRRLVSCGHPAPGTAVRIVDPESRRPCPPGAPGEIWLAGPGVTQGYWNQPEKTLETFGARIAETGEGPFLRTGDLGFLRDGQLFITGRLKDLIILDGRNHHPQDVERIVSDCHPAVRPGCCAAFSVAAEPQGEKLVVVAEIDPRRLTGEGSAASVIPAIRQAVAEALDVRVQAVALLRIGGLPKTSSGKIQRHACRAGFLAGTLPEELRDGPWRPAQEKTQ